MSNFTTTELDNLLASLQEQEIILKTILEEVPFGSYSKDKVFDALVNNITQQTLILKKQLKS